MRTDKSLSARAEKRTADARSIRRANVVVTILHVAMLAAFALAVPFVPAT